MSQEQKGEKRCSKGEFHPFDEYKKRGDKMRYNGKERHSCCSLGAESLGILALPLVFKKKKNGTKPYIPSENGEM